MYYNDIEEDDLIARFENVVYCFVQNSQISAIVGTLIALEYDSID